METLTNLTKTIYLDEDLEKKFWPFEDGLILNDHAGLNALLADISGIPLEKIKRGYRKKDGMKMSLVVEYSV